MTVSGMWVLSLSSMSPVHAGNFSDVLGQPYGLGAGAGTLAGSGGTPGRSPQSFGDLHPC